MRAISLIVLIVAALAVSAYAKKITVKCKYEKTVTPIELDFETNSVYSIISAWKEQTKNQGEFKLKLGFKEYDDADQLMYTNIVDGSTVTIQKK